MRERIAAWLPVIVLVFLAGGIGGTTFGTPVQIYATCGGWVACDTSGTQFTQLDPAATVISAVLASVVLLGISEIQRRRAR